MVLTALQKSQAAFEMRFMDEAFLPFQDPREDAHIRSDITTRDGNRRKHSSHSWQPAWDARFTGERNKHAQGQSYEDFLTQLARDLKL